MIDREAGVKLSAIVVAAQFMFVVFYRSIPCFRATIATVEFQNALFGTISYWMGGVERECHQRARRARSERRTMSCAARFAASPNTSRITAQ